MRWFLVGFFGGLIWIAGFVVINNWLDWSSMQSQRLCAICLRKLAWYRRKSFHRWCAPSSTRRDPR